jgi:hypothetical protein
MELKNVVLKKHVSQESGTTKDGKSYSKCSFLTEEQNSNYPKQVLFYAWNDTADKVMSVIEGSIVDVSLRLQSREYNGKYYSDITATDIKVVTPAVKTVSAPAVSAQPMKQDDFGDLPF